jgi:hypothetical protein
MEAWSSGRILCIFLKVSRWLPTPSFSHLWARTAARLGEVRCRSTPPLWQTPRQPMKTSNSDRHSRLSVECSREICTGCWLSLCTGETAPTLATLSPTAAEVCGTTTNGESTVNRRVSVDLTFSLPRYYTSDHFVKEVSIEEVLASPCYMLFYDRSQSRN